MLLVGSLVLGGGLRAWISLTDDGIFWPDEIYQSFEPAHRFVFGQAIMPWEFLLGARNWAFPGVIAAYLKLTDLIGLRDPDVYLDLAALLFSAASVATGYASFLLARRYGASTVAAAAGASLYALTSFAIYLAPRALSENASTLPATLGLALLLPREAPPRDRALGAALLGVAVLFRLQNAVFAVAALAVLLWRRRPADIRVAGIALGVAAAAYGLLDLVAWGAPFRSVPLYITTNLGRLDLTATFGSAAVTTLPEWYYPPADFYLRSLVTAIGPAIVVAAALAAIAWKRATDLWVVALAFFFVHSAAPHKELRYILPALPLVGALAGIGIDEAPRLLRGRAWIAAAAAAVLVVASAASAVTFRGLTFRALGVQGDRLAANAQEQLRPWKTPDASAYDDPGSVNRLLLTARGVPDLCGLKVESVLPEFQGGYTYFHRAAPLYRLGGPPRASGFFNYAITLRGEEGGGEVRASDGDMVLVRIRTSCGTDPLFDYRL
jgi:hypothetical protein